MFEFDTQWIHRSRWRLVTAAVLILVLLFPVQSHAYFNRGTVSVSLGSREITVQAGSTAQVSVAIDPIKQDQLPGCGMAECPQTCGDGCLNESGECMCAGTEYQTYYAEVSVASSRSSVATGSYSNGMLTIAGGTAGSAEITVTGKMRQYTDHSEVLRVTVVNRSSENTAGGSSGSTGSGGSSSGTSSGGQSSTGGSDNNSGGSVVVEQVPSSGSSTSVAGSSGSSETGSSGGNGTAASGAAGTASSTDQNTTSANADTETGSSAAAEPEGEVRDTAKGKYRFVELTSATDLSACFQDAINEGSHLVLQKKTGENVDYSWTFDGTELDPNADYASLNLGIGCSPSAPDILKQDLKGSNAYYMNFDYSGDLPGTAEIYMKVSEAFPEDQKLFLYQVKDRDGSLTELADDVEMSNGYASFSLNHCSSYLLTDSEIAGAKAAGETDSLSEGTDGIGWPMMVMMILTILAAVAVVILFYRRSRSRRGGRR